MESIPTGGGGGSPKALKKEDSTKTSVMRDCDQNSSSTGGCVMRDCRFE
jgi:hypothetical protein